jgi:hypothetical protein
MDGAITYIELTLRLVKGDVRRDMIATVVYASKCSANKMLTLLRRCPVDEFKYVLLPDSLSVDEQAGN